MTSLKAYQEGFAAGERSGRLAAVKEQMERITELQYEAGMYQSLYENAIGNQLRRHHLHARNADGIDLFRNIAGLDDSNLYISSHAVLVQAVREWRESARKLLEGELMEHQDGQSLDDETDASRRTTREGHR